MAHLVNMEFPCLIVRLMCVLGSLIFHCFVRTWLAIKPKIIGFGVAGGSIRGIFTTH